MSAAIIYAHPDGHEIAVGDGLLTACTSEGTPVSLPIGPAGLRDVAAKLLALADTDDADAAERAGAALGCELLNELVALHGHPQAQAFRAVREKLNALSKLEDFDSAAGGFAAAIVNTLEVGVFHLPQFEGDCP
jgi:hypothetical protein